MRTIICPHCGFSRDLPRDAIPEDATAANCPSCGTRFPLRDASFSASPQQAGEDRDRGERVICPVCSTAQAPSETCVNCGLIFSKWEEIRKEDVDFYLADSGKPLSENMARKRYRSLDGPPRAGFWLRLTAAMVDLVVLFAAQLLFGVLLSAVVMVLSVGWQFGSFGWNILMAPVELFNLVLFLAYFIVFTGYGGQTPGKMLLGIKVIRTDGGEIGYARAFLREAPGKLISTLPFGLGFLLIGVHPEKRGLHDLLAASRVVKLE
ncbi:MAG: RDD family protein [Desulfuromonadales bacterium]